MENRENIVNTEQEPTTLTPEDNRGQVGKMFTPEEVNNIVRERLARVKQEGMNATYLDREADQIQQKELDLKKRELFIKKNLNPDLIGLIQGDTYEQFEKNVNLFEKVIVDEAKSIINRHDKMMRQNPTKESSPIGSKATSPTLRMLFGLSTEKE